MSKRDAVSGQEKGRATKNIVAWDEKVVEDEGREKENILRFSSCV